MKVIVCIAKDEPEIDDWIDYHLSIGFDHVYFYANDWHFTNRHRPSVTVFSWPGRAAQLSAYNHAIVNIDFDWAAFIDCDEYIICPEGLDNFLSGRTASVAVPWKIYGNLPT